MPHIYGNNENSDGPLFNVDINDYTTCICNYIIASKAENKEELEGFFKELCDYLESNFQCFYYEGPDLKETTNENYYIIRDDSSVIDPIKLIDFCTGWKPECVNLFYQITDFENERFANNDTSKTYFNHEYCALVSMSKDDANTLGYAIDDDIYKACYFEKSDSSKSKYYTYDLDEYDVLPDDLSGLKKLKKKIEDLGLVDSSIEIYKYKKNL